MYAFKSWRILGHQNRQRALEALVTQQTLTVEERKHSLPKVVRHDQLSLVRGESKRRGCLATPPRRLALDISRLLALSVL